MLMCNPERICSSLLADILIALRKYKTQMAPIKIESSSTEEEEKGLQEPESQEHQEHTAARSNLSRAHRDRSGNHEACTCLHLAFCIHSVVLQLGDVVGFLTREMEVFMALLPACGPFFLLLGCLVQPWYEGYAQSSCILLCQVWLISLGAEEQQVWGRREEGPERGEAVVGVYESRIKKAESSTRQKQRT